MNTGTVTKPPTTSNPTGVSECVVAVRLLIPDALGTTYYFPAHNKIGTQLLSRLLRTRMEAAAVRVTEPSLGLDFNRSLYIYTVSDLARALDAVLGEIRELKLAIFAQVAWRDPREEVWRVVYPVGARFATPSDEEIAAHKKEADLVIEQLKRHIESGNEQC